MLRITRRSTRTVCSGAFASQILRPRYKSLRRQAGFVLPVNLALYLMKTAVLALYILVSFPVLILSACAALENTSSSYADYESLAPAIDQGWLPEYFPESAVNIEERHNIDTNRVSATFNHDGSDAESLSDICRVVAENANSIKLLCPPFDQATSVLVLKNDGTGYFQSEPSEI